MQVEVEFADTPRQSFGWRSVALQGRYLWLNDVEGDPYSLISALNVREVSGHSVRDVSSPYHYYLNFEFNSAIGKEWSKEGLWTMHTYALGAIGMANRGSPWLRGMGAWEANIQDRHRFLLDIEGYFGLGDEKACRRRSLPRMGQSSSPVNRSWRGLRISYADLGHIRA